MKLMQMLCVHLVITYKLKGALCSLGGEMLMFLLPNKLNYQTLYAFMTE